jgi:dihydroorotase
MSQTFDTILRGGTVVNHDGVGIRDVGITAGRIAAIGSLAVAIARACMCCQVSSTARCISANPA